MTARIVVVNSSHIDDALIDEAAAVVRGGGVIAFPTETVYGLGCRDSDGDAVRRIYRLKGRRPDKPLALYVPNVSSAQRRVRDWPTAAEVLAARFLPGPLTIVLTGPAGESLGLRISSHPVLQRLLVRLGAPLRGTSANRSGHPELTNPADVEREFAGDLDLVVDAGPAVLAAPSSVVDLTTDPPALLREGVVAAAEIEAVLGRPLRRTLSS